jgi:hypothetical protein
MNRLAAITLVLALAAGTVHARQCRDTTGKFTKCPPSAAAKAAPLAASPTMADAKSDAAADTRADGMPSASKAPVCKVGKPCGKSCIAKDKVCHKN